jgi:hypothetical protein
VRTYRNISALRRLADLLFLPGILTFVFVSAAHAQDLGWPRQKIVNGVKLVYYQPQVDDWQNFTKLDLRMAITITPPGGKTQPGVATATMQTTVDLQAHLVELTNPVVTGTYFPSLPPDAAAKLDALVRSFLSPTASLTISLDRLVASAKKAPPASVAAVNNDPPTIFLSFKPAILLQLNGEPIKAPVKDSHLEFIVNANWPLFLDKPASKYYLFDGAAWLTSSTLQSGWTWTASLPAEMSKVPQDPNWGDLKAYIPAKPGSAASSPVVYYSTTPAEVVVFQGMPSFSPIPGTQLVYATNTESTVFKYTPTNAYYYLTSGRWFMATRPLGPWTFATNSLPADFANIPPASPAGRVLSSVPGTPQAEDAVLLAQIPVTATVDPAKAAASVKVAYSGAPQFTPIQGTSLFYATNTPEKVIQVGSLYYLCFQGVWFMSTTPQGPWQTAPSVPPAIYTIPASSPVYNVTYVTQVTQVNGTVQASYTSGYVGVFVAGVATGVILTQGTGYYYPPYVVYGIGYYPVYYPYPVTYGVANIYNPYTGAYGVGHTAYGPYGSASWGATYNPYTGTYARGATASNAFGTQTVAQAYNPYTGNYGATHQGSNAYGSWGSSVVSNGNKTVYTQHETNANGSVGTIQGSQGGKGAGVSTANGNTAAGKTSNGDMYAGHDGNVYKNTGSGWETYNNGSWTPVQKPTTTTPASQSPGGNNSNATTNQQKLQSNPNYASAQQKAQSNPNYAADQQKVQSNPNYATDQQKAKTYGQQSTSPSGGYSRPSGSSSTYQRPSGGSSSYGDLDQQAQARQRGAQQSQRYSQTQRSGGGGWGGGSRR